MIILTIAIIVDILCIIGLYRVKPNKKETARNFFVIVIPSLIMYFIVGWKFGDTIYFTNTDPFGASNRVSIGTIAISICPGLIAALIWSTIDRIKHDMMFFERYGYDKSVNPILLTKIIMMIKKKRS